MKGYILRHKEVEDEAKKARKAKKQGRWIVGRWERQAEGGLKRKSGQSLFQDQPLKEEFYGLEYRRFQLMVVPRYGKSKVGLCVWPGGIRVCVLNCTFLRRGCWAWSWRERRNVGCCPGGAQANSRHPNHKTFVAAARARKWLIEDMESSCGELLSPSLLEIWTSGHGPNISEGWAVIRVDEAHCLVRVAPPRRRQFHLDLCP